MFLSNYAIILTAMVASSQALLYPASSSLGVCYTTANFVCTVNESASSFSWSLPFPSQFPSIYPSEDYYSTGVSKCRMICRISCRPFITFPFGQASIARTLVIADTGYFRSNGRIIIITGLLSSCTTHPQLLADIQAISVPENCTKV